MTHNINDFDFEDPDEAINEGGYYSALNLDYDCTDYNIKK